MFWVLYITPVICSPSECVKESRKGTAHSSTLRNILLYVLEFWCVLSPFLIFVIWIQIWLVHIGRSSLVHFQHFGKY